MLCMEFLIRNCNINIYAKLEDLKRIVNIISIITFKPFLNIYLSLMSPILLLSWVKMWSPSSQINWSIQTLYLRGDSSCSWVYCSCTGPKGGIKELILQTVVLLGGWPCSHHHLPRLEIVSTEKYSHWKNTNNQLRYSFLL